MLYTEEKLHAAMEEVLLPLPRSKQKMMILISRTIIRRAAGVLIQLLSPAGTNVPAVMRALLSRKS